MIIGWTAERGMYVVRVDSAIDNVRFTLRIGRYGMDDIIWLARAATGLLGVKPAARLLGGNEDA